MGTRRETVQLVGLAAVAAIILPFVRSCVKLVAVVAFIAGSVAVIGGAIWLASSAGWI